MPWIPAETRIAGYRGRVAFGLPGAGIASGDPENRAAYVAGGRLQADLLMSGQSYSVELWFWSGLPPDLHPITSNLISLRSNGATESVGIRGIDATPRRLFFSRSQQPDQIVTGRTGIAPRTWHHLALVREADRAIVYLDGAAESDIRNVGHAGHAGEKVSLGIGGQDDDRNHFEGKVDEVAVYDRSLSAHEIADHVQAAGHTGRK